MKLLLMADLHLRDTQPICRTDDYWKAQELKVAYIQQLVRYYSAEVLVAGDFFDTARSSQLLEVFAIANFPRHSVIIPGQHDLPNHNIKNFSKSSLGVMAASGFTVIVDEDLIKEAQKKLGQAVYGAARMVYDTRKVLMLHTMVYETNPIHDEVGGARARRILREFPDFDLIVTGDNHQPFVTESKDGRMLVNCGSMMRSDAKQIEYKPAIAIFDTSSNKVVFKYFDIDPGVISREHLEKQEQKDARIESFVRHINDGYDLSLSYKKNLEAFFAANKTRKSVQDIIWQEVER